MQNEAPPGGGSGIAAEPPPAPSGPGASGPANARPGARRPEREGGSWANAFLRRAVAWSLTITLVLAALGLTEASLLLRDGIPARQAAAVAVTTAALAFLLSLCGAPMVAVVGTIGRHLGSFWPLPLTAVSLGVGWWITGASAGNSTPLHTALVLGFAAPLVGLAWISRRAHQRLVVGAAGVVVALTYLLDLATPGDLYPGLHDLTALVMVGAALVALEPIRFRIVDARGVWLGVAIGGAAIGSVGWTAVVERLAPGFRAAARDHGRYEHRLAHTARALLDFDADGFSPIAWGGDCDDLDPDRHPLANDRPGGSRDANCNGVIPGTAPTEAERGLAPAVGDADLPKGIADLALLITVDCFRGDAFLPEVMPRLAGYASSGLQFTRSYSGGTSTRVTTKLVQRPTNRGQPVAAHLAAAGIQSTAVVGLNNVVFRPALAGFGRIVQPEQLRWSAPEVTDHALAVLREHPEPHYLWVHYYDAHTPYDEYQNLVEAQAIEPPSYPAYLAQLSRIDTSIGVLLDHLRSSGRLARAVVVITGDHGEGFGEHDVMRHHVTAFEAVTRVPAVLLAPGIVPGRNSTLVTSRDLPATILGTFGLLGPRIADVERFGRSWLRLRGSQQRPLHTFVAIRSGRPESGTSQLAPMLAIVDQRYKLVRYLTENLSELYDVSDDPSESRDLTPEQSDVAASMTRTLELYRDIDQWPEWPPGEVALE